MIVEWALALVQDAAVEPVSLAEAKMHLRIDHQEEDAYIQSLIKAARRWAERYQRRAYITQTWQLQLDGWPSVTYIRLPRPPLQAVLSVSWTDSSGITHTLDPSIYSTDTTSTPGRIVLAPGATWPDGHLSSGGAVRIEYRAGYGDIPDAVPMEIRQAILLYVGYLYEHRDPLEEATGFAGPRAAVPGGVTLRAVYELLRPSQVPAEVVP